LSRAVLDTSLILKWYLPADPLFERAVAVRERFEGIAPGFMQVELANALWKYVRAGHLDVDSACDVVSSVVDRLELVPDEVLIEAAQRLGAELDHSIYDCLYLALARREALPLVTVDKKLGRLAVALDIDVTVLATSA
jgi:predicted nucleic acid-binding protein